MIDKLVRQLFQLIVKYHIILICLIILGLFGYSLGQLRSISNPQPDPAYLNSQQQVSQPTKIQINDSLKTQIEQLEETPVDVTPNTIGKPDPFSP